MIINYNKNNAPSFQAIRLNDIEKYKARLAINNFLLVPNGLVKDRCKKEIVDIFASHIQKEAAQKAQQYFATENVEISMHKRLVHFLETLKSQKNIDYAQKVADYLNAYKPRLRRLSVDGPGPSARSKRNKRIRDHALADNNALPEKFTQSAQKMKEIFGFKESIDKMIKVVLNSNQLDSAGEELYTKYKKNFDKVIERFGIDEEIFKKCLLKRPSLFWQNPDLLIPHVENSSKFLNISENEFFKMGERCPAILDITDETLMKHYKEFRDGFYLSDEMAQKYIKTNPHALILNVSTLKKKLKDAAQKFGVDEYILTESAFRYQTVLQVTPDFLVENTKKAAELCGVKWEDYIQKCIKVPKMFCMKPETVAEQQNMIKYYKLINKENTKDNKQTFVMPACKPVKNICNDIIISLLNKKYDTNIKIHGSVDRTNLILDAIKSKNLKNITFEIPENVSTNRFIQYVQDFSTEHFGKNMFKIKVVKEK